MGFDDNEAAHHAFRWSNAGMPRWRDVQLNHIWPRSGDSSCFTAPANLCAAPSFLAKLTDHDPSIAALLRRRAFALYGWVPSGESAPPTPPGYTDLTWAEPLAPTPNLEQVLRARLNAQPMSTAARTARDIGWAFSGFAPDRQLKPCRCFLSQAPPIVAAMQAGFRRREIERAFWGLKTKKRRPPPMPAEFATRLRRLLEIDRGVDLPEAEAADYAFSEDAPGGKGHEAVFSRFDMLMLWLGLELVEMGFKQQEVVEQLRFARPLLKRALGPDLRGVAADDPALFLALPGVERSQHAWVPTPRPYLISGLALAERLVEADIDRLVLLRVGWAAFHFQERLEIAPPGPPQRRRRG